MVRCIAKTEIFCVRVTGKMMIAVDGRRGLVYHCNILGGGGGEVYC